jgi:hypothetical protein
VDRKHSLLLTILRKELLTQSAYEIDEARMNVKSCLKVGNGLLYRTVSLWPEEVRVTY